MKSQGKVRKKSGNFEIENEWQPCGAILRPFVDWLLTSSGPSLCEIQNSIFVCPSVVNFRTV